MNMQHNWVRNTSAGVYGVRSPGYMGASMAERFSDFSAARSTSADTELRANLAVLRNRSRYQSRNSGMVRRYVHLMRTNVVGRDGFRLQLMVRQGNGKFNVNLNRRVQQAWNKWTRRCTVDRKLSLTQLAHMMVGCWCRDGEGIIEIVRGRKFPTGFALKPIEADLLDETLNRAAEKGLNEIRMGVELDEDEVPVAYHFLTAHPGDSTWTNIMSRRRYRRVPADRIIHIYERLRPGQTRGEPHTAAMLGMVQMLDGYREAEIMHRRIAASTMGFFTRDHQESGTVTEMADPDEEQNDDDDIASITLNPGTFRELPRGVSFDKFDPGGVQGDYKQFESQVKKDGSMGVNLSNFSLGQETEGVSYSTGRSVLVEDRDHYKCSQQFMIETMLWPLFERWVVMESLAEKSVIPPLYIGVIADSYRFRGRGWDWVDPAKDVKANAEALATRQTSLTQIAASRGQDIRDLAEEIYMDEALFAEYGLTMNTISGNNTQDDDVDDKDDGDEPDNSNEE